MPDLDKDPREFPVWAGVLMLVLAIVVVILVIVLT